MWIFIIFFQILVLNFYFPLTGFGAYLDVKIGHFSRISVTSYSIQLILLNSNEVRY